MSFDYLISLLPCHSLDDFPVYAIGDEADGLLTAWTTPWHPALIAMTGRMPEWCRIDDLPDDTHDAILFVPGGKDLEYGLPDVVLRVVSESGCYLVQEKSQRPECLAAAFGAAGIDTNSFGDQATQDLARDFMALGYWYLQVQMLTRQMRYSTSLDDQQFAETLVKAAQHWQAHETDAAREQLTSCFNTLAQERDHYYPADAYLIDLTLVADSTTPEQILEEFAHESPANFWMTTKTLDRLKHESPEVIATIQNALENERASIYGGEAEELPLPLLSLEHILQQFKSANVSFYETLGALPQHFGRRRFGITPRLPLILDRLGYRGVVHATLDDGRFPEGDQSRTRWAGIDGTTIEAIAGVPRDAALPETFLRLAMRMGESMESDFVATLCLAHWAGNASPWYDDLRCGTRYGLALGKFATLDQFFEDTAYTGQLDEFKLDEYRSPYLKQAAVGGEADPISRWGRYWRHQAAIRARKSMQAWISMLAPNLEPDAIVTDELLDELNPTESQIDEAHAALQSHASEMARRIVPTNSDIAEESNATRGKVVINPTSAAARSTVEIECDVAKPVYACGKTNDGPQSLVDTPAFGFAWAAPSDGPNTATGADEPSAEIASESSNEDITRLILRNEFCEVRIDPAMGGISGLYDFRNRGNRLSQQLAMRLTGEGVYSKMTAETCSITSNSTIAGEVTANGQLLDNENNPIANFRQVTRLQRGSRLINLEIELESLVELGDDPWNSYFASRIAWANEAAITYRDVSQSRHATSLRRIESPLFIEIDDVKHRTAVLTGGLPYHRRVDRRQLDTILVTRGESQTTFSIAIGVDCRSVVADAWNFLLPPIVVDHPVSQAPSSQSPGPQSLGSSWLFSINARHVIATDWKARFETTDDPSEATSSSDTVTKKCVGFTVRLLDTLGRDGEVTLQSFRPIKSARRQNFLGEENMDCAVSDGAARIKIKANEWTQVEVDW